MSKENELNMDHLQRVRSHDLFSKLPDDVLHALSKHAGLKRLSKGDVLIHQGEFNYSLYLIYSGKVSVKTDGEDVASLKQGDVVGEISTSGLSTPIADIVAEGDVEVIAFPIGEISEISFEHEAFAVALRLMGMHRIEPDNY